MRRFTKTEEKINNRREDIKKGEKILNRREILNQKRRY